MEPLVTPVMPCMRAFPDLVALASLSTELGEVNMCLNVLYISVVGTYFKKRSLTNLD